MMTSDGYFDRKKVGLPRWRERVLLWVFLEVRRERHKKRGEGFLTVMKGRG
jgi:hypothetical protein